MAEVRMTKEQRMAVEDRGGSLLVSAAAGSGKTKVLVERLFRAITEERCDLDQFLIITYTRAAASELRGKIAAELNRRLSESPEDRHLRRQLLMVYRADIRTVDAFCTALLRENTHLLAGEEDRFGLSADFRVLDENEARLLRAQVLNRVLERFYAGLDADGAELADTLGFGRDDHALTELVDELYEKLQSHADPLAWLAENQARWESFRTGATAFDDTVYAAVLLRAVRERAAYQARSLADAAASMAGNAALEKGYAGAFLAMSACFDAAAAGCDGGWDAARAALEMLRFPRLSPVKDADGGEDKQRAKAVWDAAKAAAVESRALLDGTAAQAMEDLSAVAGAMAALLRLTAELARAYRAEKLRRNAADFSDQEHLALQILRTPDGAPTELGEQVAGRYWEVLVDEYQDTNEVQNAIFQAVSRSGSNLFTVGDVKQSIYRFRLADPSIFLRKYAEYRLCGEAAEGEGRKILLSQNFRSRREVLDAANFIFENILSPQMGEMAYGAEEALRCGAPGAERTDCAVEFHLLCCGGDEAEDAPDRVSAEARLVAGRIRELLDSGFPVTEEGGTRPCRPEDVVILLRSPGGRGGVYAAALAEREIPCSFEETDGFFDSMEVSTALSLLEVVDNPHQDVPLIAVLRSPAVAFTPDRLAQIRGADRQGDFFTALCADGGPDCTAFLETLNFAREQARDADVPKLLWTLYDRLNLMGIFGAMDSGARRRENLIALTAVAESFDRSGWRGVFPFVHQLRALLEADRPPAVSRTHAEGGVRIMSIHRSKGLEFPVVVLADLERSFSRQDFDTKVLVHPQLGLGPVRVELARKIQYPTAARLALEETLRRENKAEEQRILYVAMTRAKEKLILVDAMSHAQTRLRRLCALSQCPVPPEVVRGGKNFADWILLPLLCRPESAPLRELAGVGTPPLYSGDTAPWQIVVHESAGGAAAPEDHGANELPAGDDTPEAAQISPEAPAATAPDVPPHAGERDEPAFDSNILEFVYPWRRETALPAKVTATQFKGRAWDAEIAENAPQPPRLRPLRQPRFRQRSAGLTAAERGTAAHLALQYLDFSNPDVAEQVESLRARRLLTPEQADVVPTAALERLARGPLGQELRNARQIWREFPFTLLESADKLASTAAAEDSVLLQGVVDCCFTAPDGTLTVVDFKTDAVSGAALAERAERYRVQVETYAAALERVLELPVGRKLLYFLHAGETVEL